MNSTNSGIKQKKYFNDDMEKVWKNKLDSTIDQQTVAKKYGRTNWTLLMTSRLLQKSMEEEIRFYFLAHNN